MAMGFNRVILIGNLTRDPELRYTPSGVAVCDLSLAVSSTRGKGADRKEETVFVDVTVWERMAENCNEYLSKGRPVLVEGRLRQDTWDDRETGKKRSKLAVTALSVQFLGGGEGGGGARSGGSSRPASREGGSEAPRGEPRGEGASRRTDDEAPFDSAPDAGDDVPF